MSMPTLAKRLQAARQDAGISQRELARLADLSEGYPGHIESGKVVTIGSDVAERLARVLGCTLDWLIAGEGPPPTAEQIRAAVAAAKGSTESAPDSSPVATDKANGSAA